MSDILPIMIEDKFIELDAILNIYFDNNGSGLKKIIIISGSSFDITEQSRPKSFNTLKNYLHKYRRIPADKIVFYVATALEMMPVNTTDFSHE